MRDFPVELLTAAVRDLWMESNYDLPQPVEERLRAAQQAEESPLGRDIIGQILENARIAREERMPICQDTGTPTVYMEVGQEIHLVGDLEPAVNQGIAEGTKQGYLRASIVGDPLGRVNTQNNTPPVCHVRLVPGDKVRVAVYPKGGGCENMCRQTFLRPGEGEEGIVRFVTQAVKDAGGNPCPPCILGVGVGGNFETVTSLAKKAVYRPLGTTNASPRYAKLEQTLLDAVNDTGVGPQAVGGRVYALAVHVEHLPCHITALPVAVAFNCHAARVKEATL